MPSFAIEQTKALMNITARPELAFTRGEGSWLWDHSGRKYLDILQGWAVNALGHSHPAVINAIKAQADLLINPSPAFYNLPSIQLANRLTEASCFKQVFFANSGAEANEGAIKLARKWGQKNKHGAYKIITFAHSFHGRTLATMSASGKLGWDTLFAPQVPGFPKAELNDLSSVEALIDSETVAIMLEPVQGEGGVIPASTEFMQGLRQLADAHNLLLIVDEVQSGMGRTGKLFAYQHSNVKPDIMTLGKGIGAGVPLAALLANDKASVFEHGDQGGTYNGNPLMTSVGVAVFDTINAPGFLEHVNQQAQRLSEGLMALSQKYQLKGERGSGLLRALILDDNYANDIVTRARDLQPFGVLLNAPRPNLLRFMPALTITSEETDLLLSVLDSLIKDVKHG